MVSTPFTSFLKQDSIPLLQLSRHNSNTVLQRPRHFLSYRSTIFKYSASVSWFKMSALAPAIIFVLHLVGKKKRGHERLHCLLLREQLKSWSYHFYSLQSWARGNAMLNLFIYSQIYRNLFPLYFPPCLAFLFTCFLPCLFLWMPSIAPTPIRKPHTHSSFSRELSWLVQSWSGPDWDGLNLHTFVHPNCPWPSRKHMLTMHSRGWLELGSFSSYLWFCILVYF